MNPLLHIGYHKTGTTWLQQIFFPACPEFFGFSHSDIYQQFVEPNALDFCAESSRRFFEDKIDARCDDNTIPLLSFERLSGSPFSGGRDSKEIADRLARVFPRAKVLVVIREQIEAIASCYKQYVIAGGPGSLQRFLSPPALGAYSWFDPNHFRYEPLIRYYMSLYGVDNVKVMLYEKFKADNERFCNDILKFVGSTARFELREPAPPIHQSLSDISIKFYSIINRFVVSPNNPWPVLDLPVLSRMGWPLLQGLDRLGMNKLWQNRIKEKVRQKYTGMFSEYNRKLDDLLNLNLRAFGYE